MDSVFANFFVRAICILFTNYIFNTAAQGFFIQLGTVSCFTNVSLAIFYLLTIKYNQSEWQLRKVRLWLLLCPTILGFIFAFVGE